MELADELPLSCVSCGTGAAVTSMLIQADARQIPLRDGCVQAVITSPPYWGLRTYGVDNQIGLEATPEAYVAELVAVFREVWRVLKADGTVWLNLGDCYANVSGGAVSAPDRTKNQASPRLRDVSRFDGLKIKDLVGIPWRVAFALQADGWYLRSDIIWHKPNPMPESVTDRPTKAHEYLFLLTKSERYYYDAAAIAEPVSLAMEAEVEQGYEGLGLKDYEGAGVQNPSSVKARIIAGARKKQDETGNRRYTGFNERYFSPNAKHLRQEKNAAGRRIVENNQMARDAGAPHDAPFGMTRNKRSVWTIPTAPYSGAHFATFPEALVEPCVLAGSRFGDLAYDPFSGSGTVLAVAERLGRRAVGTDVNPAYHELAKERTAQRGFRFEA